jgi:hypothetical protein
MPPQVGIHACCLFSTKAWMAGLRRHDGGGDLITSFR